MNLKTAITVWLIALSTQIQILAAPSANDIREIKRIFNQQNLPNASVELATDGRLRLVGQFRDRPEVQLAFSLAQGVVGFRWVAPTTPDNVRYPGTEVIKTGILAALGSKAPARKPLVAANGEPVEGEKFALIVGVGNYSMTGINPIPNAADDAKAMVNYLGTKNFRRENLTLLLEDQATRKNVGLAMKQLESRVGPNDSVVLYFSTHGAPPNDLGNMSIVMHDTRLTGRRSIDYTTTLQDDDLKRFVEAVSPARVVIVLDVCYSGAAYSKIPGVLASTSKDLFVEESNFSTGIAPQNLTYVGGSRGDQEKILISASGPNERSWNSQKLGNGYFTYYFIDELKKSGDMQKAFLSAKPRVQSEVQRMVAEENKDPSIKQTPQGNFIPDRATLKF